MRRSWITAAGLVLLGLAAPLHAFGDPKTPAPKKPAQKTPSKRVASKPPAKPKVKKTATVAARKKARPAPAVPTKPPADIPVVTEASSVSRGCLESRDLPLLASRLGMEENRLGSLLADEHLFGTEGGACIPYVAVTGGEGGVASATFQRTDPEIGNSSILALRKTADGVTLTPGACECAEPVRRTLTVPVRDITDPSNEALATLLPSVRWQLNVLVPHMIGKIPREVFIDAVQAPSNVESPDFGTDPVRPALSGKDAFAVRVIVEDPADSGPEHLESVEVIETATGKRVDGVWWLDRQDGPGVFIGMEGLAYERLLWESPLKYVAKSRGVGPALTSFLRRVTAPKGSPGPATLVRTVVVRGYHIGVDLIAPKGTEVHAVGDATVAFAGRLGGYGNLIILDHGRGYQTYYAHLSRIVPGVKANAKVAGGELIGLVGSTGHSTAPHLHFETRKNTKYIDPFDETRQLDFWLLTADDQERLAMELLASPPALARDWKAVNVDERRPFTDER